MEYLLRDSGGFVSRSARLEPLVDHGEDGDDDDDDAGQFEVVGDHGDAAQEVPRCGHDEYPGDTADGGIADEGFEAHFRDSRDQRDEGTDQGDEAGQNEGTRTVLLKEGMGSVDVLGVENLAPESRTRFEQRRSDEASDPITHKVAGHGRHHQDTVDNNDGRPGAAAVRDVVDGCGSGEHADCEEQGITREDWENRTFDEDDEGDSPQGPMFNNIRGIEPIGHQEREQS